MKKLTIGEVDSFVKEFAKKRMRKSDALNYDVLSELHKLPIGEALIIDTEDWHTITPPTAYIPQSFRRDRSEKVFMINTLKDENGWVVIRKL